MAKPNKGKDYTWIPKVEKEHKGKPIPNGYELPEGTYTQSPGEIARRLKQHSKDFDQAQKRLNFYRNRQGKNLQHQDKNRMKQAQDALREAYGEQLTPKEKMEKKKQQTASVIRAMVKAMN